MPEFALAEVDNVRVAGISAAVPSRIIDNAVLG